MVFLNKNDMPDKLNPLYTFDQIGSTMERFGPEGKQYFQQDIWNRLYKKGEMDIGYSLHQSQINVVKNPLSTVDDWNSVAGLNSARNRWGPGSLGYDIAIKEQDILIERLSKIENMGHLAAAVSMWDDLDAMAKSYVISSFGISPDNHPDITKTLIKQAVESRKSDYWLQYNVLDRDNDLELIHHMTLRSNIVKPGQPESVYAAVDDVLSHLYQRSVVGYMDDTQMHIALPKDPNILKSGINGDMVANIGAPAFLQRVLDVHGGYENLTINLTEGNDVIFEYMHRNNLTMEMFKRELFAADGSMRVSPIVTPEGDGWGLGIIHMVKNKNTSWWEWGDNYFSNEVIGWITDQDGKDIRGTFEDAIEHTLTDEIARGYLQIQREWESWGSLSAEREIGPRSIGQVPLSVQADYDPEGYAYWVKFMEWNQEYKNAHTVPQQFLQSAWWYPLRSLQSFSTVHMDYIIKPMEEHFKTRETGPTNRPTNAQVQAYINQKAEKYGTLMKNIGDWFKKQMYIDPDFDYESYLGPPQPMMDKRYWLDHEPMRDFIWDKTPQPIKDLLDQTHNLLFDETPKT